MSQPKSDSKSLFIRRDAQRDLKAPSDLTTELRLMAASFQLSLATPEVDLTPFISGLRHFCVIGKFFAGKIASLALVDIIKHIRTIEELSR